MKYKRLGVLVENKKGDLYQVALTEDEMESVAFFLTQLQNGTIKVARKKYEQIYFEESK